MKKNALVTYHNKDIKGTASSTPPTLYEWESDLAAFSNKDGGYYPHPMKLPKKHLLCLLANKFGSSECVGLPQGDVKLAEEFT